MCLIACLPDVHVGKFKTRYFNVLKNYGYNLSHNYGLGKENLSTIFTILMMLAFPKSMGKGRVKAISVGVYPQLYC